MNLRPLAERPANYRDEHYHLQRRLKRPQLSPVQNLFQVFALLSQLMNALSTLHQGWGSFGGQREPLRHTRDLIAPDKL